MNRNFLFFNKIKKLDCSKCISVSQLMKVNLPKEDMDESDLEVLAIIHGEPDSPKLNKYFKYDGEENVVDFSLFKIELSEESEESEEN